MTQQELSKMIAEARPGAEIVYILVRIPGAGESLASATDTKAEAPAAIEDEGELDVSERIERIIEREGDIAMKPKQWARRVPGLSARMLNRAARIEGALPSDKKRTGRDNRARIIRAKDLRAFQQMMEFADKHPDTAPVWHEEVKRAGR